MRPSFFHHLHPPTIPAPQARFRYTLGAGGLLIYLVLVLLLTGILLMFYYIPTPQGAGASIQTITFLVPFGAVVRNLHYWAAQLLLVVAAIHLLRVVLTGAYGRHRRLNYLLGLALLVLAIFLDFSGYVLRWDEGIRWALVAGTNLVRSIPLLGEGLYTMVIGGSQPGPSTLVRFYAWHVFGLMLALVIVAVWHLFRVRRDGGIAAPPPLARRNPLVSTGGYPPLTNQQSVPLRISRFELVRREALAAILATVVLLVLSTFVPAPLAAPMADASTPAALVDSRAPWFFLWVQQLLRYGQPFWMGVIVPLAVLALIASFPFAFPTAQSGELGRWFPRGNRLAQAAFLIMAAGILLLTILALGTAPVG